MLCVSFSFCLFNALLKLDCCSCCFCCFFSIIILLHVLIVSMEFGVDGLNLRILGFGLRLILTLEFLYGDDEDVTCGKFGLRIKVMLLRGIK